jgi:hypothetical protein
MGQGFPEFSVIFSIIRLDFLPLSVAHLRIY